MRLPRFERFASATALGLSLLCYGRDAEAFCGFYVSGADGKLFNDATHVCVDA